MCFAESFQPHIAACYTLNQAHQLLHRIRMQLAAQPSALSSLSFAYSVGTGVGRLSSAESAMHEHSGERLLELLRGARITNVLLLVFGKEGRESAAGVEAVQRQRHERLRLLVQVARLLLRDYDRCGKELTHEMDAPALSDSAAKQAQHPQSTDLEQPTFLTQPAHSDAALIEPSAFDQEPQSPTGTVERLPKSPGLYPHVVHAPRRSHYLQSLVDVADERASPLPPPITGRSHLRPEPTRWTLDALRSDMLHALCVTPASSTNAAAFVSSSSVLCKLFHMQPALPQEAAGMISEEAYGAVKDWLNEQHDGVGLSEQCVADRATVRTAAWSCYVLLLKMLHARWRPSEVERVARERTPHIAVRLLCAAVAAVLGWDDSWEAVVAHLGGYRAVAPMAEFAEFPPPETTAWSPAFAAASSRASPYVHAKVADSPLFPAWLPAAPPTSLAVSREGSPTTLYPFYRSDLFAHLLTVPLFALPERARATAEAVLTEASMGREEVRALDGGEGWAGLLEWLVLVLRVERMYRLSRDVLTVDNEEEQGSATEPSTLSTHAAGVHSAG